jgi:hypothetical protein
MWWRWFDPARCPACRWPDGLEVRPITRVSLWGRQVRVGSVRRCARCAAEYCVSSGQVYEPEVGRRYQQDAPAKPARIPDTVWQRDSDQPWEAER